MARYLAVGNLSQNDSFEVTLAMQIFFCNREVEFLHTGSSNDVFVKERHAGRNAVKDALSGSYDLIFAGHNGFPYGNPRRPWVNNMARIVKRVTRNPNLLKGLRFPYARVGSRLAAIDMHDNPIIDNRWFQILDSCLCFFKRELSQNPCNSFLYTTARAERSDSLLRSDGFRRWLEKLRPISIGVAPETVRRFSTLNVPKKTDVFFAGNLKYQPSRVPIFEQLEGLKQEGLVIDLAQDRIPLDDFLKRCAQAYIVWSPEGVGWDCFRHYEAAVAGSVPLMSAPTIRRYAPLVEGEHALYYYVEGNDFACRVRAALLDRERLVRMGLAARQHVLQWHTQEALNRYVIEETRRSAEQARKI